MRSFSCENCGAPVAGRTSNKSFCSRSCYLGSNLNFRSDKKMSRLRQQQADACFFKRTEDYGQPSKAELRAMLAEAVKNTAAQQTREKESVR
jgi:hypothetical protein